MKPSKEAKIELVTQMEHSRRSLLDGESNPELLSALVANIPELSHKVYLLVWIPEQAEDIWILLVDGHLIAEVELSRLSHTEPLVRFEIDELRDYLNRHPKLGKAMRRRLEVAVELSQTSST